MKPTRIKHHQPANWPEILAASAAMLALTGFGYAAILAINPANKAAISILGRLV